jgi:hypothetical protein
MAIAGIREYSGICSRANVELAKEEAMSYEGKMLEQLAMPTRLLVEQMLLRTLLKHGGVIKEFGSGEEIVSKTKKEITQIQGSVGNYIDWFQAIEHAIRERVRE